MTKPNFPNVQIFRIKMTLLETQDNYKTFGTPKTIVYSTSLAQQMSPQSGDWTWPIRWADPGHMIKTDQ